MTTASPHGPGVSPVTLTVRLARLRHPAVGRNRIYEAAATGAIEAVRVGKRLALDIDSLDAWVRSGCPRATTVESDPTPPNSDLSEGPAADRCL